MDRLPSRRVLVYLAFGCLVLVGGVWGLTTSGGSAGASEILLFQEGAATSGPEDAQQSIASGGAALAVTTTSEIELLYVQVAGAVSRPGVYRVPMHSRVYEVLEQAGGVTPEADEQALSLAAPVNDGARIYVPAKGESPPAGLRQYGEGSPGDPSTPTIISLNAATQAELEELPGIGPAMAERIIAFREENGPFQSVEELDDVSGIGPALMERLRQLVVP